MKPFIALMLLLTAAACSPEAGMDPTYMDRDNPYGNKDNDADPVT